jgi:glycosyltransferase involved in cell wall biosynthesis
MADRGLRIMFLTHYFPPEIGAPQARMFELAKRLDELGDDVTVVTAFPNYPTGVLHEGYRHRFAMEERMDGVRVLRRWVFATPNSGVFKRIANWLSFVVSSLTATRKVGDVDVIFVQSPPLPIGIATLAYARLKRAPFVFNVSDIWPQSAVELGMLRNRALIRLAEALEMHLYRRASRVTVPTPGMLERLAARGVPREKLVLLSNGVDTSTYEPQAPNHQLAEQLGFDSHKVFLYAGTHGLSQGLDVILEAAKLTRDPDILYVLAGEGADKDALVAKARDEKIGNVLFLPNQPKASMPALLNVAYAGIVSLKPLDLFRDALPSKMFESMAVGQPLVAALWGEGADVVRAADCGLVTEPGNARQMRDAVETLAADPRRAQEMGRRGREYVDEHFNRHRIALRLHALLMEVVRSRP